MLACTGLRPDVDVAVNRRSVAYHIHQDQHGSVVHNSSPVKSSTVDGFGGVEPSLLLLLLCGCCKSLSHVVRVCFVCFVCFLFSTYDDVQGRQSAPDVAGRARGTRCSLGTRRRAGDATAVMSCSLQQKCSPTLEYVCESPPTILGLFFYYILQHAYLCCLLFSAFRFLFAASVFPSGVLATRRRQQAPHPFVLG